VPLRHDTTRHPRAGCAAAHARASMADTSGASVGRDRGRPKRPDDTGATSAGVATKIVSVDETPNAYGNCARCRVRRSVALSPNSASPSTAVTVIPLARTCRSNVSASCHFGCPRIAAGIRARLRCSGASQDSGRYNAAPSIHARAPVHKATVTAVWQLAIFPSAPQYWRATPTEWSPCFGKLVPSRMSTPVRSGMVARRCRHTRSADHGASVMKCWNA
jgi:hypothetical protein